MFNLSFCSDVSYAVPSPANGSVSAADLGAKYDDYAKNLYQNFTYTLAQIPCETMPEAQYSLATNCTMCGNAYKNWLCAVTIPRCTDASSNSTGAIPRNASTSRSAMIQSEIGPGVYSEIPPCGDLCFDLVRNCPASFGFACPYPQTWYYNQSYGYAGGNGSDPTCNNPSQTFGVSRGALHAPCLVSAALSAFAVAFVLG